MYPFDAPIDPAFFLLAREKSRKAETGNNQEM